MWLCRSGGGRLVFMKHTQKRGLWFEDLKHNQASRAQSLWFPARFSLTAPRCTPPPPSLPSPPCEWSESFSGCKSLWQFLGRSLAQGLYEKYSRIAVATGKGAFSERGEGGGLVIFFNPLQLEIGTLLLNCGCHGDRLSFSQRQPFQWCLPPLSYHLSLWG